MKFKAAERQVTNVLLTETVGSVNDGSGLGLFDVCPTRDAGAGCASACGQTLNKPPGTKPRDAARRFGQGTAYGDLTSAIAPEMADAWTINPSAARCSTPISGNGATRTGSRDSGFR